MDVAPPSSSPLLLLLLQNITLGSERGGGGGNLSHTLFDPSLPSSSPPPAPLLPSSSPPPAPLLPSSSPPPAPLLPSSSPPPAPLLPSSPDLERLLLWTLGEPATVALTVMYSLSFLLGIVGNVMSLRVLLGRGGGRRLAGGGVSATRDLLVNLAACDLAVVLVCMPVTLGQRIYAAWVYGDFLCAAVPFTQAAAVSASVLTLTAVSIQRYVSVRWPLRARALFTRRRVLGAVAGVWAASSTVCTPLAFMARREEVSLGAGLEVSVCREAWPEPRLKQGYNVLLFLVLYCLPVTFNLSLGFLTGRRLGGGGGGGGGVLDPRSPAFWELDPRSRALHAARLSARRSLARLVVALVLLFAVSWLPLYLADLWIDRERQRAPAWLLQGRPFAQWLGLTNSSLNPVCYCFLGDLYRSAKVVRARYLRRLAVLCRCCRRGSASSGVETAGAAGTAVERGRRQVSAVTTTATLPEPFGGRGTDKTADGGGGAPHHSDTSGWLGRSARESFLLACRPVTPSTSPLRSLCGDRNDSVLSNRDGDTGPSLPLRRDGGRAETLPLRRHSVFERVGTSPLRTERDKLPLRSYSGDRIHTLPFSPAPADGTDTSPLRGHCEEKICNTFPFKPASGRGDMAGQTSL